MNDKDLLEAAAKAAGIDLGWTSDGTPVNHMAGVYWNPLGDDGDAFRLGVKLKMEPYYTSAFVVIRAAPGLDSDIRPNEMFSWHNNDPYAATRRAIVRAAAALMAPTADVTCREMNG